VTLKLLLVIPTLDEGGAEKQLALLATGLPKTQFDVQVCALTRLGPWSEPLRRAGIPLHAIDKKWKYDPFAYRRLGRLIKRLRPDIVHTWLFAANAYGRLAAARAGAPHIVGGERCQDRWKGWFEGAIDRWLAKKSQRIVVNDPGVAEFYAGRGIATDKLVVIPNAVPPHDPTDRCSREELLAELGLPPHVRLIGVVGRLWPQKRLKDVIWASDLLKTVRQDTHTLIVGDGPHRWRLERFRRQCEIEDHVHFLGHRGDVPRLLEHLDCLWLASGYEGQSNAVLEAMAAGVPVVATDIAGNRSLVVHGETGYLVPVGDRAAFAKMTNPLLDDPDLRQRLGAAARRRAAAHFSVEAMVSRYAAFYERLAAERGTLSGSRGQPARP